jgi:ribosome assembly protein SQT1
MSNTRQHELDPEEEQDHELNDEDIVEVIDDEGDEPMDDYDDDDDDDEDNEKYDGEIVIGAPMPGEEEELANMEQMMEDNTLGATCESTLL